MARVCNAPVIAAGLQRPVALRSGGLAGVVGARRPASGAVAAVRGGFGCLLLDSRRVAGLFDSRRGRVHRGGSGATLPARLFDSADGALMGAAWPAPTIVLSTRHGSMILSAHLFRAAGGVPAPAGLFSTGAWMIDRPAGGTEGRGRRPEAFDKRGQR